MDALFYMYSHALGGLLLILYGIAIMVAVVVVLGCVGWLVACAAAGRWLHLKEWW